MNHKRSGFTLVEVVVAMMIASIVIISAGSLFLYGNRSFLRHAAVLEDGQAGDAVCKMVRDCLTYADSVMITEQESDGKETPALMFSEDGEFRLHGSEVYSRDYYRNRNIRCSLIPEDTENLVFQIEIRIEDNQGNHRYCNQVVVTLLNMKLTETAIDHRIEETGGVIDSKNQDVIIYCRTGEEFHE